jgi:hypothetical protein
MPVSFEMLEEEEEEEEEVMHLLPDQEETARDCFAL